VLIDIDSGHVIDKIALQRDFELLRSRLSEDEFELMIKRINERIDEAGGEIATAGWLPGSCASCLVMPTIRAGSGIVDCERLEELTCSGIAIYVRCGSSSTALQPGRQTLRWMSAGTAR
jgi:hypothetical protein